MTNIHQIFVIVFAPFYLTKAFTAALELFLHFPFIVCFNKNNNRNVNHVELQLVYSGPQV